MNDSCLNRLGAFLSSTTTRRSTPTFARSSRAAVRRRDLADDEEALFGDTPGQLAVRRSFEVDCALQGQEGYEKVVAAVAAGKPYHLAFVDMRMPPGWDGVQTIQKLWEADPHLHVVICSAYSAYSWKEIAAKLGSTDRLLILKKPFDELEVFQIANALTAKWLATQQAQLKLSRTGATCRGAHGGTEAGGPGRPAYRPAEPRVAQRSP